MGMNHRESLYKGDVPPVAGAEPLLELTDTSNAHEAFSRAITSFVKSSAFGSLTAEYGREMDEFNRLIARIEELCISEELRSTLLKWQVNHRVFLGGATSEKCTVVIQITPPGEETIAIEIKGRAAGDGEIDVMEWGTRPGKTIANYPLPETFAGIQTRIKEIVLQELQEQ